MKSTMAYAVYLMILCSSGLRAADLEEAFRDPSDDYKPSCYWYWLDGDITKDGITKDLEMMAKVGLRRAMLGNITLNAGGPVKMFSPEWYGLTHHALQEAARVGVDIMMFNAPGWSQSGGPWIKPEQSMRRITWNEVEAKGGAFSQKVRPDVKPLVQDVAVLAIPRKPDVTLKASVRPAVAGEASLAAASWIWHPAENGAQSAPACTRYFRRVFTVDPATLAGARMMITADNSHVLWINGREVNQGEDWKKPAEFSVLAHLRKGENVLAVSVNNTAASPAGLIASVMLLGKDGKMQTLGTDGSWVAGMAETNGWRDGANHPEGWQAARVLGPVSMAPWRLSGTTKNTALCFHHSTPFTARSLSVRGDIGAKLYALKEGQRQLVAEVHSAGNNPDTDFLPDGARAFSFKEATAQEFELEPCHLPVTAVELSSAPRVAQFIEKQMGRMHPTPSPTWNCYRFKDTVEPDDASLIVKQGEILDLTGKLAADGTLACELPLGDWTVIYFGMVTTGKRNSPAPAEGTGLEVDKMSKSLIAYHFDSMFGKLLKEVTPEEKRAWTAVTIDSYEKGAQNWTDGFEKDFKQRAGYDPIKFLPVMTGRLIDSAKASDQFLWDVRRIVADMIAENYVGGLTEIAHQHGLTTWCENYGHWGFPGEFLIYGRYSDEIGGEFWVGNGLGTIECRAGSSSCHVYGRRRVYAEAFTSGLNLGFTPYSIKTRGEELFCEGINQFVLHVVAHQPRDGAPGKNPGFGTAFHRNNPWFSESRDWVRYLQRVHFMLQQGDPVADVAVYIGDFAPQMTGPANPVPADYDYDFIGSDAIVNNLEVKNGKWVVYDEKNRDRVAASYELMAMPESGYVRPHVLKRIEKLTQAGGKLVETAPVPLDALRKLGVAPIVSETSCPIRWKARQLDDGMLFFLSNFGATGPFEAKLRVTGKAPELFNPATGEVRKIARYKVEKDGTRICINVHDRSDSFFVVFRHQAEPSVVTVKADGKDVAPADLELVCGKRNQLVASSAKKGSYLLAMSDGTEKRGTIEMDAREFPITGDWKSTNVESHGYSVKKEISFSVPAGFGKGGRIKLDLGAVEVMAKVVLNGKPLELLWMPPFETDVTDVLKDGDNKLEITVTSTVNGKPKTGDVKLKTLAVRNVE
jgi:hypothetical protein